ncbi:MAG: MarR family transcriptional regulator [Chloroflexi bacterium]|nr:MAG: MarR family transcriptional regulator [Chloroflexota bacterium]
MDRAMVAQVRRFNRIVTQRVGALNDRYLSRDRPLGEARLLWEIGAEGRDLRSLRARLGLDSGYLSRLLRSLEEAGMVTIGPNQSDRRIRTARLTATGVAERAVLDRRSDDLAASLLAPLSPSQRTRLVGAMADVERLMTAAMVEVAAVDPADPRAQSCWHAYFSDLNRRFGTGFDPARSASVPEEEVRAPAGGSLRFRGAGRAEIKRMWVAESARGLGVGRRLLGELEAHAAGHGARSVRLDTNSALTEAISLYRSAGYSEVPPFNDEAYAQHWFEKPLSAPPGSRTARS